MNRLNSRNYTIQYTIQDTRVGWLLSFLYFDFEWNSNRNAFFIILLNNVRSDILPTQCRWPMVWMFQYGWLVSVCHDSLLDAAQCLLSQVLHGHSRHQGEISVINTPPLTAFYPRVLAWSVVWTQDVSKFTKKQLNSTSTEGLFRHTGEEMTSSCFEVGK